MHLVLKKRLISTSMLYTKKLIEQYDPKGKGKEKGEGVRKEGERKGKKSWVEKESGV